MRSTVISPVSIEKRRELGIKPGDTVCVWQKIEEKDKTRLQAFEGLVLTVKHGGEAGGTFTVRRVASGVGVEKIFPLHSPMIDKIEIVRRAKARRAKLYYIREKVAREIRRQMRNTIAMNVSTESENGEMPASETAEESSPDVSEEVSREESTPKEETKTDRVGSSD